MSEERVLEASAVESVKDRLNRYWEECNACLYTINSKRAQFGSKSFKEEQLGSATFQFKALVLRLFQGCKFKLGYKPSESCVAVLRKRKPSVSMSLSEAEELFDLLTEFLEVEGVTRFEEEKYNSVIDG